MSQLHEVMLVVLVIWAGLFTYLWRLDSRVREAMRDLPGHLGAGADRVGDAPAGTPEAVLEPGPRVRPTHPPGRQGKG